MIFIAFQATNTLARAIYTPISSNSPALNPLLRFRPAQKKQINQGQITIQENHPFGGQPSYAEIVL